METTPRKTKLKSVYGTPCDPVESNPVESKVQKPKQEMSASLKERLKKSRRSFTSPFSVAKRLRIDDDVVQQASTEDKETETIHGTRIDIQNIDINRNVTTPRESPQTSSGRVSGPKPGSVQPTPKDMLQLRDQLKREVKERTETLRRLNMVKMYRSKNDLRQLRRLIDKWRSCSQAALYELQTDLPVDGKKASISQLIDLFGLEDGILLFDRTEEDFTDS